MWRVPYGTTPIASQCGTAPLPSVVTDSLLSLSDVARSICRHLLAEHPQLKIVTLSAKGEAAFLYESNARKKRIDEPSGQSILGAIRESLHPGTG